MAAYEGRYSHVGIQHGGFVSRYAKLLFAMLYLKSEQRRRNRCKRSWKHRFTRYYHQSHYQDRASCGNNELDWRLVFFNKCLIMLFDIKIDYGLKMAKEPQFKFQVAPPRGLKTDHLISRHLVFNERIFPYLTALISFLFPLCFKMSRCCN